MNETIEVVVSPIGEVSIEAKGFRGSFCRDATKSLRDALGRSLQERLTTEFHESESVQQKTTSES